MRSRRGVWHFGSAAKIDHALLQLELLAGELEEASTPKRRAVVLDAFIARRDEALRLRRDLLIHREAVGIRRNDTLERVYPIPPTPKHERTG